MTVQETPNQKVDSLIRWFSQYGSCIIAFSGGVDSSLLAHAAFRALGKNAVAVNSISLSFALRDQARAIQMAIEIGIELLRVNQDDLSDPRYVANDVSRCYFCRGNLAAAISPIAKSKQIEVCVDGTHLDDLLSPRPGIKALREAGFKAPLVELGFSKSDVREAARCACISNWDSPSESCLSSRVAYGQGIDEQILKRIESSEEFVRRIVGARTVRVRTIGRRALVEVEADSVPTAMERKFEITHALNILGYSEVEIDPEGYKQGRMLSLFVSEPR